MTTTVYFTDFFQPDSTAVQAAYFDADTGALYVRFHNGTAVSRYVDEGWNPDLVDSWGAEWHATIKYFEPGPQIYENSNLTFQQRPVVAEPHFGVNQADEPVSLEEPADEPQDDEYEPRHSDGTDVGPLATVSIYVDPALLARVFRSVDEFKGLLGGLVK